MAAKPPSAGRINARAAKDKAFLKRALKNPGLRSKLDAKYLPAAQGQQRQLNTRLNAPVTPGSSMTERDLAHAAGAATTVRYGPQETQLGQELGVSQQTERDTGSFYDQYLQQLQQHAAAVQGYQQGAQSALAQTAAGITGLAGQDFSQLQGQANQSAAQQGVAQAGNLMPDANAAAAIRQNLMGSFQAMQAGQGAAANTYADTQARVVGPGQKLSAQAQAAGRTRDVRKQVANLKAEEGAYNQSFRDTRRQDEFKNVLAQQTLTGNQTIAATKAATTAAANDPATAAAKTSATASASQAAKYGYTAHQWALLGPSARNKIISDAKKSSSTGGSDTVYTTGPFAGRKKSEIAALSDSERQKIVNDYNKKGGPKGKDGKPVLPSTQYDRDFYNKYGVKPVGTPAINKAKADISRASTWLRNLGGPTNANGQVLSNGQAAGKNPDGSPRPAVPKMDPLLVRVAMDIAQYGGVLPGTADRLHRAGYSVAKLRLKQGRKRAPYKPPSSGPAASVPGVGGN